MFRASSPTSTRHKFERLFVFFTTLPCCDSFTSGKWRNRARLNRRLISTGVTSVKLRHQRKTHWSRTFQNKCIIHKSVTFLSKVLSLAHFLTSVMKYILLYYHWYLCLNVCWGYRGCVISIFSGDLHMAKLKCGGSIKKSSIRYNYPNKYKYLQIVLEYMD